MFGKNDFGEDGERGVKNKRENWWKGCLVRRGGEEEEKNCEAQLYFLWAQFLPRTQFPQNGGENQIDNEVQNIGLKCPHARWQCFFFIFLVPFGSFNFSHQFCFLFFSCHLFFSSVLVFLIRSYSFLFFSGNNFGFLNVLFTFFFFFFFNLHQHHPLVPPIAANLSIAFR